MASAKSRTNFSCCGCRGVGLLHGREA
jgi:hypothetical protein